MCLRNNPDCYIIFEKGIPTRQKHRTKTKLARQLLGKDKLRHKRVTHRKMQAE